MKAINELWESFNAAVIPADAGEAQRTDMRRAFYSGAAAVVSMLVSSAAAGELEGAQALLDLQGDLAEFCNDMAGGRA